MIAASSRQDAAGLMDRMYRFQRHIYDATRKFYLLGRDGLITGLKPPPGGAVLEIGCGTGRNLIKIAQRYPQARCYGLDISEEMLSTARQQVAKAGLSERITLAQADATDFDPQALFGRASFERVVISYALSMIPPWREAISQAAKVTAGSGSLHVVDFGQCDGLPSAFRSLLMSWLRKFHVTPRPDLQEALAAAALPRGAAVTCTSHYRDYSRYARLDMPAE